MPKHGTPLTKGRGAVPKHRAPLALDHTHTRSAMTTYVDNNFLTGCAEKVRARTRARVAQCYMRGMLLCAETWGFEVR